MQTPAAIDRFLASLLQGEAPLWPAEWHDHLTQEQVTNRAFFHGIAGLLFQDPGSLSTWPNKPFDALKQEALGQVVWEMRHRKFLETAWDAFCDAGIETVILKGTANAYSLYEYPHCRRRGDTDLLVRENDLPSSRAVMEKIGCVRTSNSHGAFGDYHFQEVWSLPSDQGAPHDIDLHWMVTNSKALDRVLSVEEVFAFAVPLPKLHGGALATDPITRLMHGCLSRKMHAHSGYFSMNRNYYESDRLIWAEDFRRITADYSAADWRIFCARAKKSDIGAICLEGLLYSEYMLNTDLPRDVSDALDQAPKQTWVSDYIEASNEHLRFLEDLRALQGTTTRIKAIMSRLFPSAGFMRSKYPARESWPLACLYALRITKMIVQLSRQLILR